MLSNKTYTKQQIHDAMKRLLDVDFSHRETIKEKDSFVYNTSNEDFKMVVSLCDGDFSGFEPKNNNFLPPHGRVQDIKGM